MHNNNMTMDEAIEEEDFDGSDFFLDFVFYTILCIVGLVGNGLIIRIYAGYSDIRTIRNTYILNIAILESLALLMVPMNFVTFAMDHEWYLGNFLCKVYFVLGHMAEKAPIFLLTMSADQYLLVCHPIASEKWRKQWLCGLVVLIIWVLIMLGSWPIFKNADTIEFSEPQKVACTMVVHHDIKAFYAGYFWRRIIGEFIIPYLLILVLSLLILCNRHRSSVSTCDVTFSVHTSPPTIISTSQRNYCRYARNKNETRLVLATAVVHFISWCPYWVLEGVHLFLMGSDVQVSSTLFILFYSLRFSSAATKLFVYYVFDDPFKRCVIKSFSCFKTRRSPNGNDNQLGFVHFEDNEQELGI